MGAIETDGLAKEFDGTIAVDHVSFEVRRGEIFGLLGPNGAGKTTTIRMLCTLLRPTEGTARVAGYDVVDEDDQVREHIGLVSEEMIMYDRLTAYENLKLFAKLYDIPGEILDQKIGELLDLVKMSEWRDEQVGRFSSGMRQRVNVVRGLLNEPEVLFLDEPTLGLDPQSTAEIRGLIEQIKGEGDTTIVLTTHIMTEADALCDRVGIIDRGKIAALDTPSALKRKVSGRGSKVLELEGPGLDEQLLSVVESLEPVREVTMESSSRLKIMGEGDEVLDRVIDAVRSKDCKITSINDREPTLEDVFLELTGRELRDQVSEKVGTTRRGGPHGGSGGSRGRR
ncbi:ABC transporter ATPase [candidate division MSBL1 archaeon SCGC-AAA259I07]|uniref:ABC transporter ATPase n=1 Tax=candidate division MSBL1 archaeon SCGC-AAA259I07 TaxID=1698266 RepID=A0A133ULY3_9EURY|nr:ABC transporter ATPase [candidate division MSBL1 archaeon SCGC-AAA259I07]